MCPAKRILGVSVWVFILAALMGCAGPQSTKKTGKTDNLPVESVYPGFIVIYHPRIQPGMSWNAAVNDLQSLIKTTSTKGVDIIRVPDRLNTFAGSKVTGATAYYNRIEISDDNKVIKTLFFYDLLEYEIVVEGIEGATTGYIYLPKSIGLLFLTHKDRYEKVADALYFIQQTVKNHREELNKQLADFEPIAAQYRSLDLKPQISEAQRKLVVQANALREQRQYEKASEKFRKAVELDPTAYPEAYFNMALLAAQENLPVTAIFRMKQYLLLVPDARDARIAQDKIYEWELMINK